MYKKYKIYSANSVLRKPFTLIRVMFSDLYSSRELAWRLFARDISAMYRQTYLGYVWAFLPPIATTLIWVILNNNKIVSFEVADVPYPVFVLIGTLLWQIFVDSINSTLKIVSSSKSMLTKINFPYESLVLAGLYEIIFNILIRLILFVVIIFYYNIELPGTIIYAPIGIMALIMFGLMISIFLTPVGILYKDINNALIIFTTFWFYLTPVVYPSPTSYPAILLVKYNPISPLIITTRDWIISGNTNDTYSFTVIAGFSFLMIFFSWVILRVSMPHIIARSGM